MNNTEPTREQLLKEIDQLRRKVTDLENQGDTVQRAQEMVDRSGENLEKILESVPDVIFQLSPSGMIQYVSPRVKDIYGYDPNELVGEHLKKTTPLSEVPKALQAVAQVIAGKSLKDFQINQLNKQGEKVPSEINAVPIKENDRVVAVQGLMRDISQHKRIEEELRNTRDQLDQRVKERTAQLDKINKRLEQDIDERQKTEDQLRTSEENFRTIFENARDIIVYVNTRGTLININRRVKEILGYEPQELLNKNIAGLGFLKVRDLPKILSVFREVVKTHKTTPYQVMELPLRHKEGHQVQVEISTEHILKDDRLLGFLSVVRDITDRKKEEEALISSQERFKIIYEYAPDAYYMNDMMGNFIDGNQAAQKLTGYPKEELLGKSFLKLKLLPAGQLPKAAKLLALNAMGKSTGPDEFVLNRKDGTQIPVEITTHPIKIHGVSLVLGIARDITTRKEAQYKLEKSLEELKSTQAQLVQAQKMEAVGTLAGGVAHDFNNLLTAIIGYSDLLLIQYRDHEVMYEKVQEIKKAADRAAGLTRQLLAFSRRQPLRQQLLDINMTVTNMEKMLNRLIGENIRLVTRLSNKLKPVNADPGQVEQVIMNLVVNARDALPRGGNITIETDMAMVTEEQTRQNAEAQSGEFVCISITDNGTGMKKEILERIFEPFFTTKDVGKGTGLGLSVIYGIVSQHQGWLDVKSQEGKGSTFLIYLPVYSRRVEDRAAQDTNELNIQGKDRRVLLVEDETEVRNFTRDALQARGFKVMDAASATEGLMIFEKEEGKFDLVLSDVVLPDKDGLQMINQFLISNPDLKVLLCSGYADQRSQWQQIQKRGLPFLQKPYDVGQLLEAVKRALERNGS